MAVHFRPIKPSEGVSTFRGYFDKTFPRPESIQSLPDFNINLSDILSVDLTIIRTDGKEEHLELEGNTLKILTISSFNIFGLRQYQHNRAAQCVLQNNTSTITVSSTHFFVDRTLGISTLGEEILYTCHALYGKDQLYHLAKDLELLKLDTEATKTFGPHILQLATAKPFVCPVFLAVYLTKLLMHFRLYTSFYLNALISCERKSRDDEHGYPRWSET